MQDNFIKIIAVVAIWGSLSACGGKDVAEIATPVLPTQAVIFPTPMQKATATPLPVPVTFTPSPPTPSATVIVPATFTAPPSFSMGGVSTALSTPTAPSNSAESVIADYAETILGISVNVVSAPSADFMATLPADVQKSVNSVMGKAQTTYVGTMDDGVASVSFGANHSDDDSVAIFVFQSEQDLPSDADEALVLLRERFPGIAWLPYRLKEKGLTVGIGKMMLPTPEGGLPAVGDKLQENGFTFLTVVQQDGAEISAWIGVNTTADGQSVLFAAVGMGKMLFEME